MRTYCSLLISSDADSGLATTVLRVLGLSGGEIVDTQAPEMISRRLRLAEMIGGKPATPPRYFWRLSSKDQSESTDVEAHITLLLGQLSPGRYLSQIADYECRVYITCFWAGPGRGGGPILSTKVLKTLLTMALNCSSTFMPRKRISKAERGPS